MIDGHVGGIHGGLGVCDFTEAVVIVHHRAYLFTAKPNIDIWQDRVYDRALFNRMLATVSFTS